ncbi:hypothetical protein [uncultured Roseobacter sp.]|uniref:hypothetical protein n=1 Tax=uncultured Roseobacter sp. TaxID=114847 RepID=UPI00262B31C5|nr:hypothetical protein [uncultured Roseobacter sp.]
MGVVLWSDPSDRKAVIWCEDQGDLAFLNAGDDAWHSGSFFDAGDMVQFEMEVHASMRRARNPRLVLEQVGCELPETLRQRGTSQPPAPDGFGAKVIPFKPRCAESVAPYRQASKA